MDHSRVHRYPIKSSLVNCFFLNVLIELASKAEAFGNVLANFQDVDTLFNWEGQRKRNATKAMGRP